MKSTQDHIMCALWHQLMGGISVQWTLRLHSLSTLQGIQVSDHTKMEVL